jgi:hypothetical protein
MFFSQVRNSILITDIEVLIINLIAVNGSYFHLIQTLLWNTDVHHGHYKRPAVDPIVRVFSTCCRIRVLNIHVLRFWRNKRRALVLYAEEKAFKQAHTQNFYYYYWWADLRLCIIFKFENYVIMLSCRTHNCKILRCIYIRIYTKVLVRHII